MASDLASQILDYLARTGVPTKAKLIASALGAERSSVNQVLYGSLKGKVTQGKDYNWSLADAKSRDDQEGSSKAGNSYEGLFKYYLDCISQDDDSGVQTFADSRFELSYVELGHWPLEEGGQGMDSTELTNLVGRQRRDARTKVLWLGYPSSLRRIRSRKGWEGTFLEPIFIWPQDTDSSELRFLSEPLINPKALAGLAPSENVLEEVVALADELGLDAAELPPLDDMCARLESLRPEWAWSEKLDICRLRGRGELRKLEQSGIYNAAVVALTDRSPFTVGLERELAELRHVANDQLAVTALGAALGSPGNSQSIEGPLLEPALLNSEQRMAVAQALTEPLTVITGPPGTGKSQVVTAILVNAAWRGMRVLFASKNNKAVDVVMERVNTLSSRPTVLRLGSRALQSQLAERLTEVLSSRPTDSERNAYSNASRKLAGAVQVLNGLNNEVQKLVDLRNRVDELEQSAEAARAILGREVFDNASSIALESIERKLLNLRQAIREARFGDARFMLRLVWPLIRGRRERRASAEAGGVSAMLAPFGFSSDSPDPTALLGDGWKFLEGLTAASQYQYALSELERSKNIGELSGAIAEQAKIVASDSQEVWTTWADLLPDRLTDEDRRILGEYAAVLRMIVSSEDDKSSVGRQLWRRYYDLAARTSKALPCWAVTSLSVRGRVPFAPNEFDLVVIDEASQCDIASAIPLLYRAKRAAIIGDPQQLRHISRLPHQRDHALLLKHNLMDKPGLSWSYQANSLYDLAATCSGSRSIVVLRDHHRSHADIINFSNAFFYGGKLRVATDYQQLKRPQGPAIRWIDVKGSVSRPPTGGAINQREAASVVNELHQLAVTQRFIGEMGVVTPFRAQANLIQELVNQDEALAPVLASRNFICETAHRFQGDERDVMIFSPVVSVGMPAGAAGFLRSQGNIFNVSITRARGALVVVGDWQSCSTSDIDYLSAFARYVSEKEGFKVGATFEEGVDLGRAYPTVARPELVSDWERLFYSALYEAGIRAIPQYPLDQYILDFAVIRPNGRRLNIEVDGEKYHRDWDGELLRRDQLRNLRLIELGWDVMRLWVYEVRDHLPRSIERVLKWVNDADAASSMH